MSALRDLVLWPMDEHYSPHHRLRPGSLWHDDPFDNLSSAFGALERRMHQFEKDVNHLMGESADHKMQPWSDILKNFPKGVEMTDAENGRKMQLKLDMKVFNPEDIKVTLKDKVLVLEAKKEDDHGESGKSYQHYYRQYTLPEDVKTDTFKSFLTKEGLLKIQAELPPALEAPKPKEAAIPIEKKQ